MKAIAKDFVKAICKEYDVWHCEPTGKEIEVDIVKWVTENNPAWLEDDGACFEEES